MGYSKEEKVIRDLLKLPENRRCINCKTLGPQYVCTTFWTFVCANCSGVHWEFNHHVKSISSSKFNSEEVSALRAGGNERATQIYFKAWDRRHHSFPDNSNIQKLRDFIKHVYLERRYTADNSHIRFNNIKNEEHYERKSGDPVQKSWFKQRSLDRYGKYSFKERCSRYERENSSRDRYGGLRSTSSRLEGEQYQVDNARIAGRSATAMFTTADLTPKGKSPVPHVMEILGENWRRLCAEDLPKPSEKRNHYENSNNAEIRSHSKANNINVDCPTFGQEEHAHKSGDGSKSFHRRSASAFAQIDGQLSNETSRDNTKTKLRNGSVGSLVDITNVPPPEACKEQPEKTHVLINGGNPESSQPPPTEETGPNIPAKNTLEYLLFELSCPVETPLSSHSGVSAIEEVEKTPSTEQPQQHYVIPVTDSSNPPQQNSIVSILDEATQSTQQQQHQHSVLSILDGSAESTQQSEQNFTISVLDGADSSLQTSRTNEVADNPIDALSIVPSFAVLAPDKNPVSQSSVMEAGSSGRAEIPADLFSSFSPQGPLSGWQMGPGHGMGFNMQHHPSSMQMLAYPNLTKSRNPFDTDDSTTQHYATNVMFPSITTSQGRLISLSTSPGMSCTSNSSSDPQGFVPTHLSSYSSGAYMGQNFYSNMQHTRQHELGGHGSDQGSWNVYQQPQHTYQAHNNMSSFHKGGGNPFA